MSGTRVLVAGASIAGPDLSGECFTDLIERALNGAELPHYARVAY
jgi:hypothetical protein